MTAARTAVAAKNVATAKLLCRLAAPAPLLCLDRYDKGVLRGCDDVHEVLLLAFLHCRLDG